MEGWRGGGDGEVVRVWGDGKKGAGGWHIVQYSLNTMHTVDNANPYTVQ